MDEAKPYPRVVYTNNCHNCIHEQDPYFVLGSALRTLVVGSSIFIVAIAWSEFVRLFFEKYNSENLFDEHELKFNSALKYAVIVTLAAFLLTFLVMFYVPGTKW